MADFLAAALLSLPLEEEATSKSALPFAHFYNKNPEAPAPVTNVEEDLIDFSDDLSVKDNTENNDCVTNIIRVKELREQQQELQGGCVATVVRYEPAKLGRVSATGNCTKSNFVLPSNIGSCNQRISILKAVRNAISGNHDECKISMEQSGNAPSLLLTAASTSSLYSYINKCREEANLEIKRRRPSSRTCRKVLLKPLEFDASQARVTMQKFATNRGHGQIRPQLVKSPSQSMRPSAEYSDALISFRTTLEQNVLDQLDALLARDTTFTVVARFGRLRLQEWKGSASTFPEFATMMQHPRTRATIVDRFGDARTATTLLSAIRAEGQELFEPTEIDSSQAQGPSIHTMEAYMDGRRVMAKLERSARGHKSDYTVAFEAIEVTSQPAAFQLQVLRLGQNIDWMIEACPDAKLVPLARPLLYRAAIDSVRDSVGEFPRFRNCHFLKDVTIKSVYEYQWANTLTPFLVEIVVLRSWGSTVSCSRGDEPEISLSVTIRDDESGLDIEKETVGHLIENIGLLAEIIDDMVEV